MRKWTRSLWWQLSAVLVVIAAIKAAFLLLDSTPSFFYGDSLSYLAVATLKWIPPDRSFLYGLLIRRIAWKAHSLESLIFFQATCSCLAAWLLSYALVRELRTRFWLAALFGILCAVEPMQLMMERYVMTEATSNFLFALHFVLILAYLRRGRLWDLLWAQAVAVALIGIRISFLPEVLMNSVLVPLLSPAAIRFYRTKARDRGALKTACVHLVLCLFVCQALLGVYKRWYGRLTQREPALLYEDGAFLISDLAPILTKGDFPSNSRRDAIFRRVTIKQSDINNRLAQHFTSGGIWHAIQTEYPNPKQANEVALAAVRHALVRDPLGAVKLAVETYALYLNPARMRAELAVDEGVGGRLSPDVRDWLRIRYRVRDPKDYQLTLTKEWHRSAAIWCWMILIVLPLSPAIFVLTRSRDLSQMIVIVATAWVFLIGVTLTVDHPTPRYLTTSAWLVLIILAISVERAIGYSESHRIPKCGRSASHEEPAAGLSAITTPFSPR